MAVIEMASFTPFSDAHLTFLEQLSETLGVVLNTIIATMRTEELLQQSQGLTLELQSQSEELQSQRDELERTNQELEEQARSLKASEELLQQQQEELQQTNEELEEKAALLAEQNARIEQKNAEVELARARARGEGRAARALVEVQERVPREHEPRAAHAAQLAAHPREAPLGQPGGDAHRQAGRVREDDLQRGLRPARADQRHPRPLEGRGREDGRQPAAASSPTARRRLRRAARSGPVADQKDARVRGRASSDGLPRRSSPTSSGCSRC